MSEMEVDNNPAELTPLSIEVDKLLPVDIDVGSLLLSDTNPVAISTLK
jgi:hypothetical protein